MNLSGKNVVVFGMRSVGQKVYHCLTGQGIKVTHFLNSVPRYKEPTRKEHLTGTLENLLCNLFAESQFGHFKFFLNRKLRQGLNLDAVVYADMPFFWMGLNKTLTCAYSGRKFRSTFDEIQMLRIGADLTLKLLSPHIKAGGQIVILHANPSLNAGMFSSESEKNRVEELQKAIDGHRGWIQSLEQDPCLKEKGVTVTPIIYPMRMALPQDDFLTSLCTVKSSKAASDILQALGISDVFADEKSVA